MNPVVFNTRNSVIYVIHVIHVIKFLNVQNHDVNPQKIGKLAIVKEYQQPLSLCKQIL